MKKLWEKLKKEFFIAETLRYLIVGIFSVIIDFGFAGIVKNIGFASKSVFFNSNAAAIGTAVGWLTASIASFFGNKIFVFKSKSWSPGKVAKEFFGTIGSRGFSFFISFFGMKFFVDNDIFHFVPYACRRWGWTTHLAKEIVLFWAWRCVLGLFEVAFNYIINKVLIFRKKKGGETEQNIEENTL